MKAPNPKRPMNLPPDSMPWGRWVEQGVIDNAGAALALAGDGAAVNKTLQAKADILSDQIYDLGGSANIAVVPIPDFTHTFVANKSADYVLFPIVRIPAIFSPSSGFIFCNIHAEWISGGGASRLAHPNTRISANDSPQGGSGYVRINSQMGVGADRNRYDGWATGDAVNNLPRGRRGYWERQVCFSVGDTGTTPMTVRFTNCTMGVVEMGGVK